MTLQAVDQMTRSVPRVRFFQGEPVTMPDYAMQGHSGSFYHIVQ